MQAAVRRMATDRGLRMLPAACSAECLWKSQRPCHRSPQGHEPTELRLLSRTVLGPTAAQAAAASEVGCPQIAMGGAPIISESMYSSCACHMHGVVICFHTMVLEPIFVKPAMCTRCSTPAVARHYGSSRPALQQQ